MYIKRLHIGDFGILRNQTLEDLDPGIVVIGGANRAGKSTFMQVLRYLGYGIPSGGSVPPANVEYMIDSDISMGDEYHIRIQGLSEPICTLAGKINRIPVSDIYKLDAFSYRNLFTISLDQLARIPEGISKNEFDKLQSVLLGAGLGDIANIPRLEEKFNKSAAAIGGSTGRLSNKGFKTHMKFIREGVQKKNKALGQVEEYQKQQIQLDKLKEKETDLREALKKLCSRRDLLEAVKGNYDMFEELSEIEQLLSQHEGRKISANLPMENQSAVKALYEHYRELKGRLEQKYNEFSEGSGGREQADTLLKELLEHRILLQEYFDKLSGLEARWDHLIDLNQKLEENREDVLAKMQRMHSNWTIKDMEMIRNLPLEMLEEGRLTKSVSRFRKLENQLEHIDSRLEEAQDRAEALQNQKKEWEKQTSLPGLKLYFRVSALSALIGLVISFFHIPGGLLLGLLGILGAVLVSLYKGMGQKEAQIRLKDIQGNLDSCLAQLTGLQADRKLLLNDLNNLEAELSDAGSKLGLTDTPDPGSLLEYYRSLTNIQEGIRRLDRQQEEFKEHSDRLNARLTEIQRLLSRFEKPGLKNEEYNANIEGISPEAWQAVQSSVKKWHNKLQTAVSVDQLSLEIKKTGARIYQLIGLEKEDTADRANKIDTLAENYFSLYESRLDYLNRENRKMVLLQSLKRTASSRRVIEALKLSFTEDRLESPLKGLLKVFYEFPARESLDREYTEQMKEIQDREGELEICRNEINKANLFLEQLSLTDQLEQAHSLIQKGRGGLYQESYHYAVYKTAAWLCREIKNGFLEKSKDELLLQADNILKQLTGGDYQRIIPNEDLSDFSFAMEDGSMQEGSTVLSRGTREQVFLAVRLGRILESNALLPVIIDDSLVNFDAAHLRQAAAVFTQLSKRKYQVFLMTCHPHMVDLLLNTGIPAQYWNLENGHFTRTSGADLSETLHFSGPSC